MTSPTSGGPKPRTGNADAWNVRLALVLGVIALLWVCRNVRHPLVSSSVFGFSSVYYDPTWLYLSDSEDAFWLVPTLIGVPVLAVWLLSRRPKAGRVLAGGYCGWMVVTYLWFLQQPYANVWRTLGGTPFSPSFTPLVYLYWIEVLVVSVSVIGLIAAFYSLGAGALNLRRRRRPFAIAVIGYGLAGFTIAMFASESESMLIGSGVGILMAVGTMVISQKAGLSRQSHQPASTPKIPGDDSGTATDDNFDVLNWSNVDTSNTEKSAGAEAQSGGSKPDTDDSTIEPNSVEVEWQYESEPTPNSLVAGGSTLCTVEEGTITRIDGGRTRWQYHNDDLAGVGIDRSIIITGGGGWVQALDGAEERWAVPYRTGDTFDDDPTVSGDFGVIQGTSGELYALDMAECTLEWAREIDGLQDGLAVSGRTAFVTLDEGVIAVSRAEEQWRVTCPRPTTNPDPRGDGLVVGTQSGVIGIGTDDTVWEDDIEAGDVVWRADIGRVEGLGRLATTWIARTDDCVYAIDDGEVAWEQPLETTHGPAVVDGSVVVADEQTIYAVDDDGITELMDANVVEIETTSDGAAVATDDAVFHLG